ncbi:class I SAM-dependent methyltransferase [bacterium]|nr:class I SAM-dependent methyltransferase [bacterium]
MVNSKDQKQLRDEVLQHFETIAPEYDLYKKRSEYYYSQLKQLLKELLPNHDKIEIVEIGCGTGSLLFDLHPQKGCGIDISKKMIEIARSRGKDRPEISFCVGEAEKLELSCHWDAVIMSDVLEHLYNPEKALKRLAEVVIPGTTLVITWANSLWEPILHILEKLKMKMPEGAHNWENRKTVISYLKEAGFKIEEEGTRCLIPARLPFADKINKNLIKLPIIRHLGLIRYIKAERNA